MWNKISQGEKILARCLSATNDKGNLILTNFLRVSELSLATNKVSLGGKAFLKACGISKGRGLLSTASIEVSRATNAKHYRKK